MNSGSRFKMPFSRNSLWGMLITVSVVIGLAVDTAGAGSSDTTKGDFYSDIMLLDAVTSKIHQKYVVDVNSTDLVDNAVRGMLSILDPHTAFFKPKGFDELRIHTEGKFGGLGIQIAIQEKVLTVMTPIPGTPAERAGIQSGDKIVKIDGKSTQGITVDKAVDKLRGEPGTPVKLTIVRKGVPEPTDYSLIRDIITIKSVPFSGVLDNGVGYVKLLQFSEESGDEVDKAVRGLMAKGIKGLILDLRHNPGGLLNQAQEVSEKFLKKGSLIVSTRGRVSPQQDDYSHSDPILPDSVPMIVLVDEASASAAEIVSGAMQDHDRAVILGDTSFGKGSVQSIEQLDATHHIKLTEAFYYTPSGRCINKPENGVRGARHDDGGEIDGGTDMGADQPDSTDSVSIKKAKKDTLIFHTKAGRVVYGGGGIIPDTIVKQPIFDPIVRALFIKDVFFRFATNEYPLLGKRGVKVDANYVPDQKVMEDFRSFLDSIKFDYRPFAAIKYDEFRKWAGILADTTADSARYSIDRPEWTKDERAELEKMAAKVSDMCTSEGKRAFNAKNDEIARYVRTAVLVRALGQDNETIYRLNLSADVQIKAALAVIGNRAVFDHFLKPSAKAKK